MREYNGMRLYEDPVEVKTILMNNNLIAQLNIDPKVKELLMNADKEKLLTNVDAHMQKISSHSRFVGEFCKQAGIPERGENHDKSKWSERELFESIYFFEGTRSPIDKANEVLGWSPAFAHHVQVNDHQLEHNIYINGGTITPLEPSFDAAVEVICDFCGAAKAYLGDKFTFQGELEWWNKRMEVLQGGGTIHPKMAEFITETLKVCAERDGMITYDEMKQIWDNVHLDKTQEKIQSPLSRLVDAKVQKAPSIDETDRDDPDEECL